MDELSVEGPSYVAELNNGSVSEYTVEPGQFGLDVHALSSIQVDGAEQSLALIHDVLDDKPGAARDIVLLNSGAAIYVGGAAESIEAGIDSARQALSSGAAAATLASLITVTQGFMNEQA
jgi:anthranilate phosphoribosyltransferase